MKVGDIVYFYETWSDAVIKGRVTNISELGTEVNCSCCVDEKGEEVCEQYGRTLRTKEELFFSAQEAYDTHAKQSHDKLCEYCKEIETVTDLIRFPLKHCLKGEEYTDQIARQAYEIRTKDLLGIDIRRD